MHQLWRVFGLCVSVIFAIQAYNVVDPIVNVNGKVMTEIWPTEHKVQNFFCRVYDIAAS